ncbi:MAG: hypothetical protein LBL99_04170, partial [Holosporaceae bacterium]|nr:hypothetical protein [Holosporaceae bacterium]
VSKFWSFISELFVFIRPRRPLDGIIVTLPADMLISEAFDVEKHARELFERIFKFQRDVNFHLPIYLIVTKMDLIPGVCEFAHLLNDNAKQQIFGWSCPYSINTAFSTEWIDEIFYAVDEGIRKATLNYSAEKEPSNDLEKAILFQYNVDRIKSSLTQYLHSMFQSHNPEDGLILRGVYFAGKQKRVELASPEIISPAALVPGANVSFANSYNDNLYFVQDLFREKIFKEYNIAYPIKIDAIDMNKTEQRNKIILVASSTLIALGWFWGNNNIKEKIREYYLAMASVKTSMNKIKFMEASLKSEEDQAQINKETTTLLKNMPIVKRFDLISIFVPQSWFSTICHEALETIGLVFDSVIIRAMYIDINLDTKNILQNALNNFGSSSKKRDLFDVNSFESFKKLRDFSKQIGGIEKVSAEYNAIRQLEDRKSVADLTSTLFKENFHIADEVKNRIPNKKLIPPKFDIAAFRDKIEDNLKSVYAMFLRDVLDVAVEKILQNLSQDIERIVETSQNGGERYSAQDLAKTYNKTVLISDIFKSKNFAWITNSHFIPCPAYAEIMNRLAVSDVIRQSCVKELIQTGELEFHKFRARLAEFKTDLTDELISSDMTSVSTGFSAFQKEIQAVLDQPFICVTQKGKLVTTILEDKMLIWEIKRLKELSGLIDKYYEFCDAMPKDIRPQFYEIYKAIARKCFYPIIDSMLGAAQIFEDAPLGRSNNLLEDAYKRQATNIKDASVALPKIAKLLDEIEEEDNIKDIGFSSMIISHYSALLEKIDALFNQETPYSSGHAVFDNWDGDRTPQYLNIGDKNDLKAYLTAQFERIRFLAKDAASPIVDLLSMPHFADKIKVHGILKKWREIIDSIDAYEAQKPGNSIAALENFISDTLSKVSIDSFDDQGEIKTISETSGDYFLSKRSDVAKLLISRADMVKYERAAESYNKIEEFFNKNLAHKFPFGSSADDASLKDIEDFVTLFERQNVKNMIEVLERNKAIKGINEKSIEFLRKMNDKLIPFLKTWIAHSKSSDASGALVTFGVQTRPSPEIEAEATAVMDRELLIDNVKVDEKASGLYFNDNKVEITFNWAEGDEKPNDKKAGGNLTIDGKKATFSYSGKWAMFRLIEENKANKESEAPNGVLLQFNIPIVDSSKNDAELTSKLVVKVTPMTKDKDKAAPTEWPAFLESCPNLHEHEETPTASVPTEKKLDVDVSFDAFPKSGGA